MPGAEGRQQNRRIGHEAVFWAQAPTYFKCWPITAATPCSLGRCEYEDGDKGGTWQRSQISPSERLTWQQTGAPGLQPKQGPEYRQLLVYSLLPAWTVDQTSRAGPSLPVEEASRLETPIKNLTGDLSVH